MDTMQRIQSRQLPVFVQKLLQQMQNRFQAMSQSIISKVDEMGNQIEELEQSINDLRAEMGQEGSPSPSAPLNGRDDSQLVDSSPWNEHALPSGLLVLLLLVFPRVSHFIY